MRISGFMVGEESGKLAGKSIVTGSDAAASVQKEENSRCTH
jgi:hypothetical protein